MTVDKELNLGLKYIYLLHQITWQRNK